MGRNGEMDAPPPFSTLFEKDIREGEALNPCSIARLQAGDEILRINGQNIESWRRSQVSEAMEGSIGTLQLVVKKEAISHGMGGRAMIRSSSPSRSPISSNRSAHPHRECQGASLPTFAHLSPR